MLEAEVSRPQLQQRGEEPDAFKVEGCARATDSVYWRVMGLSCFLQENIDHNNSCLHFRNPQLCVCVYV